MAGRIEDYAIIGGMQTATLVCSDGSIDWLCLPRLDAGACFAALLERITRFWRDWAARCTYQGQYREAVLRSLITLKALTCEPAGGIVAAAPILAAGRADNKSACEAGVRPHLAAAGAEAGTHRSTA